MSTVVSRDALEKIASDAAINAGLDPVDIKCIIEQESSWDQWAWNPEPAYKYLVNVQTKKPFRQLTVQERISEIPPADFPVIAGDRDQEWWAQQSSWGLMQVMGGAARESGFTGPYLPALLDPSLNVLIGCQWFLKKLRLAGQDLQKALLFWNGGGDKSYPAKVMARRSNYITGVL